MQNMSELTLELHNHSIPIALHGEGEAICDIIRQSKTFYEIEILEFLRRNVPVHKVVLDVGANIGNHALYMLEFLTLEKLVCFEPFPPNYALLERNIGARATLEKTALGDSEYTTGMRYVEGNLGSPFLDRGVAGEIPVRTLDSYQFADVTLLKIDVEIHFMEVLRGAVDTIRRCRPVLIVEGKYEELFPFLMQFGYAAVVYWRQYDTHCLVPMRK